MSNTIDFEQIQRYLSGNCTKEERELVENWLKASEKNQNLIEMFKISRESIENSSAAIDRNEAWEYVREKLEKDKKLSTGEQNKIYETEKTPWNFSRFLKYAAVLIMITAPLFYYQISRQKNSAEPKLITTNVEYGQHMTLNLTDGTKVTLDAGSTLAYPEKFNRDNREVFLNGEGYFEVKQNPNRPFIVNTGNAEIKVLGTKFNVRAWEQTKKVEVTVSEGKVSLKPMKKEAENSGVIISRGFFSSLESDGKPSIPRRVNTEKYLGWMKFEIVFENVRLYEILDQLERWYKLKFEIDKSSASEHLTIHIQNKPVNDILELISALTGLKYTRTDDTVSFKK